jgi:conjugative transfer signal peptidase TraF
MRQAVRAGLLLSALGLFLLACLFHGAAPPVLFNGSASAPPGLYRRVSRSFEVGDLVAACLPEELAVLARERGYVGHGACPGEARPVLKRVAATGGAWVRLIGDRIQIDGEPVRSSSLRTLDREGRPLPIRISYPFRVPAGGVLLLNPHPDSFDGRYFGPIERSAVLGAYRPLWTVGGSE